MGFQNHQTSQKPFTADFKVPDFYPHFSCKGTTCKETCCQKWRVTISMNEYFNLHGLNCKKKLKDKLDRSLRLLEPRTKDRYAEISKNEEGKCPLLLPNGYCELHSELGEKVLPTVCRYFPRGPRGTYYPTLSTSNGCERTLELLFSTDEVLRFTTHKQSFTFPEIKSTKTALEIAQFDRIQMTCFQALANREITFPNRIYEIGSILQREEEPTQLIPNYSFTFDFHETLSMLFELSDFYIENNPSMAPFCLHAKEVFSSTNPQQTYEDLKKQLSFILPNHEILFEKMLTNTLFFKQFPDQEHTANFFDEYLSLSGIYVFLRYLLLSFIQDIHSIDDFITLMTKLFRVISHTRFERNMIILLKNHGIDSLTKTTTYLSF